jgi:hypothetical protein
MSLRTPFLGALLLLLMAVLPVRAQETPAAPDTTQNAALRAFLDCDVRGCDRDFLVTEMKWVNWMRDRLDADFHLLVTSQVTGSGGRKFQVVAIGQRAFTGRTDTLEFNADPNDASDTIRRSLLRVISQLLLPYAARGPLGSQLSVSFTPGAGGAATAAPARDKWNFWTYSISMNGFLDGESRQSQSEVWTNLNANRTTEAWKIQLSTRASYQESNFTYDTLAVVGVDSTYVPVTFTSIQRNSGLSALVVKSINDHWSTGFSAEVRQSDFNNIDLSEELNFAVEWDFYPYKDFARRKLAVLYAVGMRDMRFREVTIYDRMRETRPVHSIEITFGAKQKWGSANIELEGSQYLNALKYYNAGVGGSVEVRLGKGLSFQIDGRLSRVRDQLGLPAGGLTPTEVVARQQQLATNYRYFTFFGLRYQFGSIFNSVVNPRFGGGDDF